eukprot:scaffold31977_cov51-Attheya_sp.AAC.2
MSERSTRKRRERGKVRKETTIDGVIVEEPFFFSLPKNPESRTKLSAALDTKEETTGDGCYISATVDRRRYYGVLIDQNALKAASLLSFQEDVDSLNLNRRMMVLWREKLKEPETTNFASSMVPDSEPKRQKLMTIPGKTSTEDTNKVTNSHAVESMETPDLGDVTKPVQKFEYIESRGVAKTSEPGYRILLATYASVLAAGEGKKERALLIHAACQSGGDFVDDNYYCYQVLDAQLLTALNGQAKKSDFRTSMSFHSFLHNTPMPTWYPLSNLETKAGQSKILNMLQMKKDGKGGVKWGAPAFATSKQLNGGSLHQDVALPMAPRARVRIGVVGGGIAGLASAYELLRMSVAERIDLEVVLFEARSRLGGRLWTERETFKGSDGETPFPVDLGASWIHGITDNPLTTMAREAGIDLINAEEEVKMLGGKMKQVERDRDLEMGKLFDHLLDKGAENCWSRDEYVEDHQRHQKAVRWYASSLRKADHGQDSKKGIIAADAPRHRHSSDISIDHAFGEVLTRERKQFRRLSEEEHNLILWNIKNTEYALGANIQDLSMKYWDTDEEHAFEGEHVLLKQGYSTIIDHMLTKCATFGDKFQCLLNCPVESIEYSRKSTSHPYRNSQNIVDLSDTCQITVRDKPDTYKFDCVVCALPLGVLKHSVESAEVPISRATASSDGNIPAPDKSLVFHPPLPLAKQDAIRNIGFGLLNKVYLQFPEPFWRKEPNDVEKSSPFLSKGQCLFGNASGYNPHHYMFLDIGRSLGDESNSPAILMTMISGSEAVIAEKTLNEDLINDVLSTLRFLFPATHIPPPVATKATQWGSDEFSRGCYTFLPPGATDQDYHILQCPVNGNGEALMLPKSETMRLFFAGEHTSYLHPSMAHGAYLSGVRAASEIFSNLRRNPSNQESASCDRQIPIIMFRTKYPEHPLECNFCHEVGSRKNEGALLAFQRGARQVLAHQNCAIFSPEVGYKKGVWKNVIKSINRGKQIVCSSCNKYGGTIGCTNMGCFRSFHFRCCEKTGWDFDRDGKIFFCDLHRSHRPASNTENTSQGSPNPSFSKRIPIELYSLKNPLSPITCSLCHKGVDQEPKRGPMLGFQRDDRQVLVHENCTRYANVVDKSSASDKTIFGLMAQSRQCFRCGIDGATIRCLFSSGCFRHFHVNCAEESGWNFEEKGVEFVCEHHKVQKDNSIHCNEELLSPMIESVPPKSTFQHDLFCKGAGKVENGNANGTKNRSRPPRIQKASNDEMGYMPPPDITATTDSHNKIDIDSDSSWEDIDELHHSKQSEIHYKAVAEAPFTIDPILSIFSTEKTAEENTNRHFKRIQRSSLDQPWDICFRVDPGPKTTLQVDDQGNRAIASGLLTGDIIVSMNGQKLGSDSLKNISMVMKLMKGTLDLVLEIVRGDPL